jgi:hypothetical protein
LDPRVLRDLEEKKVAQELKVIRVFLVQQVLWVQQDQKEMKVREEEMEKMVL